MKQTGIRILFVCLALFTWMVPLLGFTDSPQEPTELNDAENKQTNEQKSAETTETAEDVETASTESDEIQQDPDKQLYITTNLLLSFLPMGRTIKTDYIDDRFSVELALGFQSEFLFIIPKPNVRIGLLAQFLFQLGLGKEVDLLDGNGVKYGTVAYKYSLIPMAGPIMHFQLSDKLAFRGGITAGYDRSFISIASTLQDETQSGGGFALQALTGLDIHLKVSEKFTLLLGGELTYLFGITDKLGQNYPCISVKAGGLF